jgi:ABC-type uncharacterized transport system permease subunit
MPTLATWRALLYAEEKNKMITINGREYNEEHIAFRSRTSYPTPECFIYIWQTSNSVEEYQQKMTDIYWHDLQKNDPVAYATQKAAGYVYGGYKQPLAVANRFRTDHKIPLKHFPTRDRRRRDWAALRKFAESLNDEQ